MRSVHGEFNWPYRQERKYHFKHERDVTTVEHANATHYQTLGGYAVAELPGFPVCVGFITFGSYRPNGKAKPLGSL